MTIYGRMNAYDQFLEIRENIGETSAAHWTDVGILTKMCQAQRRLWQQLQEVPGDWSAASALLTPSNSVITLPDDCGKPIYMEEESSGREISISMTVRERRLTRGIGSSLETGLVEAYPIGNTLEVNMNGYGEQVRLWYVKRLRDLHFGTAGSSSAAQVLHFDTAKKPHYEDDYYNSLEVEVQDSSNVPNLADTITDYVASTGFATITGTAASGELYGTISQLPEEAHYLIVLMTTVLCLAKPGSDFDPQYLQYYQRELRDGKREWEEWISQRVLDSRHVRVTEVD